MVAGLLDRWTDEGKERGGRSAVALLERSLGNEPAALIDDSGIPQVEPGLGGFGVGAEGLGAVLRAEAEVARRAAETALATPEVPMETTASPAPASRPSAAAALSPEPGPTTAPEASEPAAARIRSKSKMAPTWW